MDENKVLLLLQLVNNLDNIYLDLEKAYNSSDKPRFDKSKKAVLELQSKLNFLLTKNVA